MTIDEEGKIGLDNNKIKCLDLAIKNCYKSFLGESKHKNRSPYG